MTEDLVWGNVDSSLGKHVDFCNGVFKNGNKKGIKWEGKYLRYFVIQGILSYSVIPEHI